MPETKTRGFYTRFSDNMSSRRVGRPSRFPYAVEQVLAAMGQVEGSPQGETWRLDDGYWAKVARVLGHPSPATNKKVRTKLYFRQSGKPAYDFRFVRHLLSNIDAQVDLNKILADVMKTRVGRPSRFTHSVEQVLAAMGQVEGSPQRETWRLDDGYWAKVARVLGHPSPATNKKVRTKLYFRQSGKPAYDFRFVRHLLSNIDAQVDLNKILADVMTK
ncbi:Hypothetical predicted protein, partial [Paramuricea clavata]